MRVFISYKTDTRYRLERSTIEAHRILHYSTSLPCRIVPIHGITHCITYTNIHTSWAIYTYKYTTYRAKGLWPYSTCIHT